MKMKQKKFPACILAAVTVLAPLSLQSTAFPYVCAAETGDITGDSQSNTDDIQKLQKCLV